MKKRMALSSLFIVTVVSLGSLWAQDAAEIIRRADQSLSSGRYYSVATITITRGARSSRCRRSNPSAWRRMA
jgi:hypothetical protein